MRQSTSLIAPGATTRPPGRTSPRSGRYLYAIVAGSGNRTYGACGIDGGEVYAISDGAVAAVVSDVPNENIRPERRHLAAAQQVLRRLLEETTPLPVSFGIIADSARAVEKILATNQLAFVEQLECVAGKVEMGLRVTWDVPNIFEYFVNTHPELKAARDRVLGRERQPTPEEKMELGRLFDRLLQEDRELYTDKVESVLSPYCSQTKTNKCRDEREVMNLACLVGNRARAEFEAGILKAAQLFDNSFAFNYNGPWAPYNFVTMNLML